MVFGEDKTRPEVRSTEDIEVEWEGRGNRSRRRWWQGRIAP